MRQAGFEPTTFGSGGGDGQRTPALAVAVSRVSESSRRSSTAGDAFPVTIAVTEIASCNAMQVTVEMPAPVFNLLCVEPVDAVAVQGAATARSVDITIHLKRLTVPLVGLKPT